MEFSRQEYWSGFQFPTRSVCTHMYVCVHGGVLSLPFSPSGGAVAGRGTLQGLKLGSCLTLGNELSEETHADKARDFIGKGHPGGEQ